jgi:hypothetical protein
MAITIAEVETIITSTVNVVEDDEFSTRKDVGALVDTAGSGRGVGNIDGAGFGIGNVPHTQSSSSEQIVEELVIVHSPSSQAPQHEYEVSVGQAVHSPLSKSAGYVVLQL